MRSVRGVGAVLLLSLSSAAVAQEGGASVVLEIPHPLQRSAGLRLDPVDGNRHPVSVDHEADGNGVDAADRVDSRQHAALGGADEVFASGPSEPHGAAPGRTARGTGWTCESRSRRETVGIGPA